MRQLFDILWLDDTISPDYLIDLRRIILHRLIMPYVYANIGIELKIAAALVSKKNDLSKWKGGQNYKI